MCRSFLYYLLLYDQQFWYFVHKHITTFCTRFKATFGIKTHQQWCPSNNTNSNTITSFISGVINLNRMLGNKCCWYGNTIKSALNCKKTVFRAQFQKMGQGVASA